MTLLLIRSLPALSSGQAGDDAVIPPEIPTGKVTIEVDVKFDGREPQTPATVTFRVDGKQVGQGRVGRSVTSGFSGSETLDIGMDLGSPVSLDYHKRAPFRFNGSIEKVNIKYI